MAIIPREYQKQAVKAALLALKSVRKALVVLATGLGKTFTAAFVTQEFCPKRTLFLVHNNFILDHAVNEFRQVFSEKTKMAIYNGLSKNGASEADIVFSTWQTMGNKLDDWARDYFDLVIVDEAHHAEAETYRPVLKYFTAPKLGITATPDRQDEADIREVFGPEVIDITLEEAIARGWLPRIEYHVITDKSLDDDALQEIVKEIRDSKKRFTMAEVNRRLFIRERDEKVARMINDYKEKAIVFCSSIVHADRMAVSLESADIFHSEAGESQKDTWKENLAVLAKLENGPIRRVCAVNAFNEGVNVPSVGLVAFCRVTGSETIFRQQLGRGLRPGKDKLIVLDFVGNLERIQAVLAMMNKVSDLHEQFTSPEEIAREGYTRQQFEVSGKGFEFTFSDKIADIMAVLRHCESNFYPTWQEAGEAAKKLGIEICEGYRENYKRDERLPSHPRQIYSNFPGWKVFLGKEKYSTWQEASQATRKLGIRSWTEYQENYKRDEKLPSCLHKAYLDFPSWTVFLGKEERVEKYTTWQEASEAAQRLGIKSRSEYQENYKKDEKLPSCPYRIYPDFPWWFTFLGKEERVEKYTTWQEASEAAQRLGIRGSVEYQKNYKRDERLPSDPNDTYSEFPGWTVFLGTDRLKPRNKEEMYFSWQEASEAAKKLGIKSQREYKRNYKEDEKLPSNPNITYPDFPGWTVFLGKEERVEKYTTWQEASEAAQRLGIKSRSEYQENYKKDEKLPSCPNEVYSDFPGWRVFLGKEK